MKLLFTAFFSTLSLCLLAQQNDSSKIEIKNLGTQVNSPFPDYAPLISADGDMMIFTSRRPTAQKDIIKGVEGTENVYSTYYDDKHAKWLVTFLLGPTINLPGVDNSAIALSNDGQRMLLYRGGNEQNANGDILESSLVGEEWSDPIRLPPPINTDFDETSASISPDGRTIYFVSDRNWGYGGRDIWSCTQDSTGNWGEAINMGRAINTEQDEEGVYIHPNGKVLFFSSKGHNSIGGYDIFMSVFDETTQTWAKAENLGVPINTTGDDIYFELQANGKTGYYASSQSGGATDVDIYSATFPENILKKNVTLLKGRIINKEEVALGSTIVVTNKTTGKLIGSFKSNKTTGKYLVSLPPGIKYEFEITADGYNTNSIPIDIPYKAGYTEILKDIILEKK